MGQIEHEFDQWRLGRLDWLPFMTTTYKSKYEVHLKTIHDLQKSSDTIVPSMRRYFFKHVR